MPSQYHEVYIGALDVSRFVQTITDESHVFTLGNHDGTIMFKARIRRDTRTYEDLRLITKVGMVVPIYARAGNRIYTVWNSRIEFFGHGLYFFAPEGLRATMFDIAKAINNFGSSIAETMAPALQNLSDAFANFGINIEDLNNAETED